MNIEEKINLRRLNYSPSINPFIGDGESGTIILKKRFIRTGVKDGLVNINTGEIEAAKVIYYREYKDDEAFVKVFVAGVTATYNLNKTANRVFMAILREYERTPMRGGYIDWVYLAWHSGGLCGQNIEMSEKTFQSGLKELIRLKFILPRSPNTFWVNPTLFFKGDRAVFIKDYVRIKEKQKEKHDAVSVASSQEIENATD